MQNHIIKNKSSQKIYIFAENATTRVGVTGQAANITARISKDGGAVVQTTDVNPTEVDATYMPGVYAFDMTQAETNANMILLAALCTTSGIVIYPEVIMTMPDVDLAAKADKKLLNKAEYNKSTGKQTVYDDDGMSILMSFNFNETAGVESRIRTDA
ncbi:hypothetical protein ACQ9LF_06120 [Anaerohalosphaeraceae bacterium U12dextr]|jgi:hypothetical protein